jgi:triphosphoribosyl-dephospho-CoA synthase
MTPAENAQLALLLEVSGTPKPGNVDRERDLPDLRFEQFLAGGVGAGSGLSAAADGVPVGEAFEQAVAGMSQQAGGNTQFGALLLLAPLVRAAAEGEGDLSRESVARVVENTTVEDAANFYRAFDHADVYVDDPPEDAEALDARRGSDAVPAVEEQEVTLYEVMELGADSDEDSPGDDVAAEWTGGFERTFWAADRLAELAESSRSSLTAESTPASAIGAQVYLELLAREPDTLVAKQHGSKVAESVRVRAQEALEGGPEVVEAFADALVADGVNPGTTADITAAALFVALERGAMSV